MRKIFAVAETFALGFGALTECVEAKTMAFEVAGRRYSYETSKVQQVAAARKLIEVANAADAAKATADAEREANPLVKVIGSPAQKAATDAQARLAEAVATYEQETAAMQRQPTGQDVGTGKSSSVTRGRAGLRTTRAPSGQADTSKDEQAAPKASQEATAARSTSSNPVQSRPPAQPAVKNVFTDVSSGIKTIFMTDGSIREEPIDGSKSSISFDGGDASASTGSINRAR